MANGKRMNSGGKNVGQMSGDSGKEKFAEPFGGAMGAPVSGMTSGSGSNSERTGFDTTGYIDKQGTPYGEAAKFNFLPPGMDISNQENAEIYDMPMKKITAMSYPGDGWGSEKDIPE